MKCISHKKTEQSPPQSFSGGLVLLAGRSLLENDRVKPHCFTVTINGSLLVVQIFLYKLHLCSKTICIGLLSVKLRLNIRVNDTLDVIRAVVCGGGATIVA